MLDNLAITTAEWQQMNDNISLEVEEDFTFAEASPMPSANRAYTGLYSEQSSFGSASQSEGD